MTATNILTEHQQAWWGIQKCRRCNMDGLPSRGDLASSVICPDCDGTGWTVWAALATEPWTEIIPNLFIGCHDYNVGYHGEQDIKPAYPRDAFDLVVSMYRRGIEFEPTGGEHIEYLFGDAELTDEVARQAWDASLRVADGIRAGKKVLSRCQAGLNRSSLVAGLAMIRLGFSGADAVQLIRARRSPWALCNEDFVDFLLKARPEGTATRDDLSHLEASSAGHH